MDRADVVLLLISPDFIASDYCYKIEKARALERHQAGEARLVSVILRPCDWTHTDLRNYLVTPTDGKPLTQWPNRDEAFLDVAKSIRRAIEELGKAGAPEVVHEFIGDTATEAPEEELPRSSNLRLRKDFSQADKDRFLLEAFEYMERFFEGSLKELEKRNGDIETRLRKIDGNAFTATIYRNGDKAAACGIRLGGMIGNGITYSQGDQAPANSCNDSMSVGNDDQKLFLHPMGIAHAGGSNQKSALSHEGAAEYYWSLLIRHLQGK